MVDEHYQPFVEAGRRRFRVVVAVILFCLLAALFAPWVAARAGVITSDTAEAFTVVTALVIFAAWQALLINVGDPENASAFGKNRGWRRLGAMAAVGAALLATMLALGLVALFAGLISFKGLGWVALFAILLGGQLIKATVKTAMRSAGGG